MDRVRLILGFSERLLKYLDENMLDIEDSEPFRTTQLLSSHLLDSIDPIGEDEIRYLLDELKDLAEKDEYDIGMGDMLETVTARIGKMQ